MKSFLYYIAMICLPIMWGQDVQAQSKLIAKGASLEKLAADYIFTEGPAVDAAGNVFFTDQPNNRILQWHTDGTISVFMEAAGRANGLYFDHEGNLLACADELNQLWRIDKEKKVTVLIENVEGKKLNGPNDLWVDPKGGIYFTDPFYKRSYWTRKGKEIEKENVYYLSPEKQLRLVADDLVKPNGIIGSANGKQLYVADIGDKKTYVYDIGEDGSLKGRKLFVLMGSDGMTLDHKGNLYLTGREGVSVFNKRGKKILLIPVDERWTANVCFGGKDQRSLFITAMGALYSIKMKVKGIR